MSRLKKSADGVRILTGDEARKMPTGRSVGMAVPIDVQQGVVHQLEAQIGHRKCLLRIELDDAYRLPDSPGKVRYVKVVVSEILD